MAPSQSSSKGMSSVAAQALAAASWGMAGSTALPAPTPSASTAKEAQPGGHTGTEGMYMPMRHPCVTNYPFTPDIYTGTKFTFDQSSGLYYDSTSGFYYDPTNQVGSQIFSIICIHTSASICGAAGLPILQRRAEDVYVLGCPSEGIRQI
jgi:hypothetical protein